MHKLKQEHQNTDHKSKAFWIVETEDTHVAEPVELTLAELNAVAGGPEVENGSSNLTAGQTWF